MGRSCTCTRVIKEQLVEGIDQGALAMQEKSQLVELKLGQFRAAQAAQFQPDHRYR